MSYHSALALDRNEAASVTAGDDTALFYGRCPVCGQDAEYRPTGDCHNAACPRMAAINQMDPPPLVWLAGLEAEGIRPPRRGRTTVNG